MIQVNLHPHVLFKVVTNVRVSAIVSLLFIPPGYISCGCFLKGKLGKSKLQVPDTGTRVLDNTTPFLCSSIVSF